MTDLGLTVMQKPICLTVLVIFKEFMVKTSQNVCFFEFGVKKFS